RAAREPKSLWLMPGTGPAPNSLMAQAGEYQSAVTGFLRVLDGGEPERVAAEWQETGGGSSIEVTLSGMGGTGAAAWAVQTGVADVQRIAGKIRQLEREGPFPAALEAMLAETFYLVGKQLVAEHDPALHAEGLVWLRRAVAAEPAKPALWFWPGTTAIYGFPH